MSARIRRAVVTAIAVALTAAVGAGVAAADHSNTTSVRADHIWCC